MISMAVFYLKYGNERSDRENPAGNFDVDSTPKFDCARCERNRY